MAVLASPSTSTVPARPSADRRSLVAPAIGTGLLMLVYLVVRPYGDADSGQTMEAARAFASNPWVVAHVAGALALACFAWLALQHALVVPGRSSALSAGTALAGLVLVLPYYGAETFALHVIGDRAAGGDQIALELIDPIRNNPVAMTMFGLGLVMIAFAAVLLALIWWREDTGPAWAVWPLTAAVVLFLPQFFLPPGGRVTYGVLYAVSAGLLLLGLRGRTRR